MGGKEGERRAAALLRGWRRARLDAADAALCAFAERLAKRPGATTDASVEALRRAGFDDRAIHDAVQVVAYFAYINRVADGLGVDLEPGMPPDPRTRRRRYRTNSRRGLARRSARKER